MASKDSDKKIDLNLDDLDNSGASAKLVVELDDLPPEGHLAKLYPGLPGASPVQHQSKPTAVTSKAVHHLALAGLLGGFIAWLLSELFFRHDGLGYGSYAQVLLNSSLFGAVVGGVIGAIIGSVEGFSSRVPTKVLSGAGISFMIGSIGGAAGGFTGQLVYGWLGGGMLDAIMVQVMVRGFGWALIGLFIGLGQGISTGGGRKIINGLIGGLTGGLAGGLLFDVVGMAFNSGIASRAVALSLLGLFTGLAIGIVQEIRKEAWLKAIEGATAGKEYIIHSARTTIGSAVKNDIVLIKDPGVSSFHAEINMTNNTYMISAFPDTGDVLINNRRTSQHRLNNADVIGLGDYRLQYFEKAIS